MLAESATVADSSEKRRTGLLKHTELKSGDGLWIVPCEGVHTFGMKFAIDVLFLSRKRKDSPFVRVLKVRHSMPKSRMSWSLLAHSVLELPAGVAELTGTQKGDELEMERYEA